MRNIDCLRGPTTVRVGFRTMDVWTQSSTTTEAHTALYLSRRLASAQHERSDVIAREPNVRMYTVVSSESEKGH